MRLIKKLLFLIPLCILLIGCGKKKTTTTKKTTTKAKTTTTTKATTTSPTTTEGKLTGECVVSGNWWHEEYGTIEGFGTYQAYETATLKATAYEGYRFDSWYIDDKFYSKDTEITLTVDKKEIYVYATFSEMYYVLTINKNIDEAALLYYHSEIDEGEETEIISYTDEDYKFLGWYDEEDNLINANEAFNYSIDKDTTLTAKYEKKEYTVNVSSSDEFYGTVKVYDNVKVGNKEVINLVATPSPFYKFDFWAYNGWVYSFDPVVDATITKDTDFVAYFDPIEYNLTLVNDSIQIGDTLYEGNIRGGGKYDAFMPLAEIRAFDVPNYKFVGWYTKDGGLITTESEYVVELYKDVEIYAKYKYVQYKITIINHTSYNFTGAKSGDEFNYGDQIALVLSTLKNVRWVVDGVEKQKNYFVTFYVPDHDFTVEIYSS